MMTLSNLRPKAGSIKKRKRVGRGPGSGYGKTAGRGMNGQKSRSGYSKKRGFEGGQMPLVRRVPKRGFTNIFRKEYNVINLGELNLLDVKEVTIQGFFDLKLVKRKKYGIKILGQGELTKKIKIHAHKFSKSALEKIEKSGSEAIVEKLIKIKINNSESEIEKGENN